MTRSADAPGNLGDELASASIVSLDNLFGRGLVCVEAEACDPARGDRLSQVLQRLPAGGCVGLVIAVVGDSVSQRISRILLMRFHLARTRRSLTRCGAIVVGSFAIGPDLRAPTWVYPLAGTAARYARSHLLSWRTGRLWEASRGVLSIVGGCEPSVAGVIVIGRRP
jgi:hypothetical protein